MTHDYDIDKHKRCCHGSITAFSPCRDRGLIGKLCVCLHKLEIVLWQASLTLPLSRLRQQSKEKMRYFGFVESPSQSQSLECNEVSLFRL